MFQSEALLPVQLMHGLPKQGEVRLMLAILEDALHCASQYQPAIGGRQRRLFVEAYEWIQRRDRQWLFSFESICDTLGIEPDFIRWRVRQLHQAHAADHH